jgi:fucose permease
MTGLLRPVTELTITAAFIFGMLQALLGSLKLSLSRSLDLGAGRVGTSLALQNLALSAMMFLTGVLVDWYGVQPILILSSVAAALALFALSNDLTQRRAFIAVALGGLGAAGLCTCSVVLMPAAFFPQKPTAALNAGCVFFALGALVTPALNDVLMRLIGNRRAFILLALACLVPAVLGALTAAEDLRVAGTASPDLADLFSHRPLWLAALVFAVYAPLEGAVSFWAITYFKNRDSANRSASQLLAGYWGGFVVSRLLVFALIFGTYIGTNWDSWILVVATLLSAVALGNIAGTVGTNWAGRGLLLLGFCLGPIAPMLVGLVFERLELHGYGTAFGSLFVAGSLGSLVLAPAISLYYRRQAPHPSPAILMIAALMLTALTLVFVLVS